METFAQADGVLDADTLHPLPLVLQQGLMAVCFLGFLSFFSSFTLFVYLTYKLVRWHLYGQARKGYNQYLLLYYNLLLADIQQSLAYLLTSQWLVEQKIDVQSPACYAQGWFMSIGDLASGIWILAIAMHTFFAIVKGQKPSNRLFLCAVAGLWIFIYAMAITGVALHPPDFYGRAGAWCFIREHYASDRLWLHYLWIFIAMFGAVFLYTVIYSTLRSRVRSQSSDSSTNLMQLSLQNSTRNNTNRAARYMIVYPTVYVFCTLPLASARMAAMNGHIVTYWYFCMAGAAITSCGWLDVLLYACTRRALVFSTIAPSADQLGVDTFGIFGPQEDFLGVRTTIEGGVLADPTVSTLRRRTQEKSSSISQGMVMDDTFAVALPDRIITKTTLQVRTEPRAPTLSESEYPPVIPPPTTPSKADTLSLDRSPAGTLVGNEWEVQEAKHNC